MYEDFRSEVSSTLIQRSQCGATQHVHVHNRNILFFSLNWLRLSSIIYADIILISCKDCGGKKYYFVRLYALKHIGVGRQHIVLYHKTIRRSGLLRSLLTFVVSGGQHTRGVHKTRTKERGTHTFIVLCFVFCQAWFRCSSVFSVRMLN